MTTKTKKNIATFTQHGNAETKSEGDKRIAENKKIILEGFDKNIEAVMGILDKPFEIKVLLKKLRNDFKMTGEIDLAELRKASRAVNNLFIMARRLAAYSNELDVCVEKMGDKN